MKKWQSSKKLMGSVLGVFALLGLLASLVLGAETIAGLKDSSYEPACNVNPIISCGSVMESGYSEIFGIPNPVFGLIGFGALLSFVVIFLSGSVIRRRVWMLVGLASIGGLAFVGWLFFVSMALLGSICPWCALLWFSTIGVFWSVTTYMSANGICDWSGWSKILARLWTKYALPILIILYLVLVIIAFLRFQSFWLSLL